MGTWLLRKKTVTMEAVETNGKMESYGGANRVSWETSSTQIPRLSLPKTTVTTTQQSKQGRGIEFFI